MKCVQICLLGAPKDAHAEEHQEEHEEPKLEEKIESVIPAKSVASNKDDGKSKMSEGEAIQVNSVSLQDVAVSINDNPQDYNPAEKMAEHHIAKTVAVHDKKMLSQSNLRQSQLHRAHPGKSAYEAEAVLE